MLEARLSAVLKSRSIIHQCHIRTAAIFLWYQVLETYRIFKILTIILLLHFSLSEKAFQGKSTYSKAIS